jgi:hypothetical protein
MVGYGFSGNFNLLLWCEGMTGAGACSWSLEKRYSSSPVVSQLEPSTGRDSHSRANY